MHVVGCHYFHSAVARHFYKQRQNALLIGNVVILNFDVVVVAEQRLVSVHHLIRLVHIVIKQCLRKFAGKARRKTDYALGVVFKQIEIYSRLVVKPASIALADHFYKIFIAGFVFGKQHEVIEFGHFSACGNAHVHVFGDVYFAPDNWFYLKRAAFLYKIERIGFWIGVTDCRFYEFERAVHISVIGNCDSGHAQFSALIENSRKTRSAVQQTVFCVQM